MIMGKRNRWAGHIAMTALFVLLPGPSAVGASGIHDAPGSVWAVRKPPVEPAPGPGLFQSLPKSVLATDPAQVSAEQAPQTIADRTGIAANVIIRSRSVKIDSTALAGLVPVTVPLVRAKSDISGPATRFALFGDADIQVVPQSMQRTGDGALVWTGSVLGEPGSSVSLVIKGGAVTGDIFMAGRTFKIRATGSPKAGSVHEIIEVDENAYGHGSLTNQTPVNHNVDGLMPDGSKSDSSSIAGSPKSQSASGSSIPTIKAAAAASTNIPVLFAYTPKVASLLAAKGQDVNAVVQNAVSVVNSVWSSSGVNAVVVPTIVASGSDIPDGDIYTLADHLNFISGYYAGPAVGYGKLRQLRDATPTALLQLIVAPGTSESFCGIAYVPSSPVTASDMTTGYSAVRYDCLGTTNAHEIGHNMGLNHDRITDSITSQSVYNVGWIDKVALTRDVMSYPNPCQSCVLQRLYSSPLLTVKGAAFGVPAGGVDPADGVRAVNENISGIASYRPTAIASPDATQIEMAVSLTAASTQGSTPIANAQSGQLCSPKNSTAGTVWFTHTPTVTGTTSFTISNISGSDIICAYPATPRGTVTYNAASSDAPYVYPSLQVQASNANGNLQISLPGTSGVPVYVGVNSLLSGSLPIIGRAVTAVPQNGWWWDPAYGGIGFALETSASSNGVPTMFIAGFFYDVSGNPVWGISSGAMTDASTFSGSLSGFSGGNPYGSPTKATTGSTNYGAISLKFTSPTTGTLTWPGGTLNLQRYSVDTKPIDYSGATGSAGFDSGWYWVKNDSGRGAFVEQMGTSLFAALFQYDSAGRAIWQIVTGSKISNGSWQGALNDFTGGTAPTTAYRPATQRNNFGNATISTSFPTAGYKVLFNKSAPGSFPSTYYSAYNLSISLPGVASRLTFDRYRF